MKTIKDYVSPYAYGACITALKIALLVNDKSEYFNLRSFILPTKLLDYLDEALDGWQSLYVWLYEKHRIDVGDNYKKYRATNHAWIESMIKELEQ